LPILQGIKRSLGEKEKRGVHSWSGGWWVIRKRAAGDSKKDRVKKSYEEDIIKISS